MKQKKYFWFFFVPSVPDDSSHCGRGKSILTAVIGEAERLKPTRASHFHLTCSAGNDKMWPLDSERTEISASRPQNQPARNAGNLPLLRNSALIFHFYVGTACENGHLFQREPTQGKRDSSLAADAVLSIIQISANRYSKRSEDFIINMVLGGNNSRNRSRSNASGTCSTGCLGCVATASGLA